MKYLVTLTYSKTTRQPVYAADVVAASKTQAIHEAQEMARLDGFKGTPIKVRAIQSQEAA